MRSLVLVALAALLASCASVPTVRSDYDPTAQFAQYRTYSWREIPRGGPALVMQRIVDDIDAQLAAKGWQRMEEGGDIALAAHVASYQKHQIDTFYDAPMWGGWGWYGPWPWWGAGMGYSRTRATSFTVGTLLVDMFDARTKRAVWSSVAEGTVPSKPAQVNQKIDQAVAKMFAGFPPGSTPP